MQSVNCETAHRCIHTCTRAHTHTDTHTHTYSPCKSLEELGGREKLTMSFMSLLSCLCLCSLGLVTQRHWVTMKWSRHRWVWTETHTAVLLLMTDSAVQKYQDGYDSQSPRGKKQLPNNFKQILGLQRVWGHIKKYKHQQWKFCSTANHPASLLHIKKKTTPPTCFPLDCVQNKEVIVS